MFHDGPSSSGGRRQLGWPQLQLGGGAAADAAKSEGADRGRAQAAIGETLEGCCTPAVAAQAVELQRVVAIEQVFDGVQADGGGHRLRVRSMRVQEVSLARASASPDVTL